jgi:hypothetical protein
MTTPIDDFTLEELDEFYCRIGQVLFRSPAACLFARHAKPLSTISDGRRQGARGCKAVSRRICTRVDEV